jgi:hypothetical protein
MIATQGTFGTAIVAPDCSGGTYTAGSVTADTMDTFSFTVTDNNSVGDPAGPMSDTASVSVTINDDVVVRCEDQFPVTSVTTNGGGQSPTVNATLSITFTGNITGSTNNSVKLCPGTTATYEAVSTLGAGTESCTVSGSASAATGTVAPGQKLICTNKPTGSDTDRFRILAGP